ncbi:MAG: 23S rRNA (pseudouridine(1915)-N(3))-methyltransferase RlmH [Parachlamydiales bacterium]|jgi:23S rRNA (pseudouridine1915-N3)-methyltransferase
MFIVKIFSIHKTKEKWLQEAICEYEKRLKNNFLIKWEICKDEADLEKKILNESFFICLDEKGQKLTSLDFSKKLFEFFQSNNLKINFLIGSDVGISKKIKDKASFVLSLSDLTFTHQMIRLILIEQIYRAYQIHENTKYHK